MGDFAIIDVQTATQAHQAVTETLDPVSLDVMLDGNLLVVLVCTACQTLLYCFIINKLYNMLLQLISDILLVNQSQNIFNLLFTFTIL